MIIMKMEKEKLLSRRLLCPYGTKPGYCLNTQCLNHLPEGFMSNQSDVEKDLVFERMCVEDAIKKKEKQDRYEFLKNERKLMGMSEPTDEEKNKVPLYQKKTNDAAVQEKLKLCPPIDIGKLAAKRKTFRKPARKLCMLDVPSFKAPEDDYNDLSNFLRISTMPGYSSNDYVSEYKDRHNMSVWNNRRDIDKQAFKLTRDWLSVWSDYDVIERRWRKAWAEKFSS